MKLLTIRLPKTSRKLAALLLALFAFGCARAPVPDTTTAADKTRDPMEACNRKMFVFNDDLDRWVMKPVADGYAKVTPAPARRCISNFFANIEMIQTIPNQFLQGKSHIGFQDTGRFVTNTTVGVVGLFDVARRWGMPPHEEDFGQTFAVWGMPEGPYLVVPLFGPMTARDAPGRLVSVALNLVLFGGMNEVARTSLSALETVDTRASADNDLDKVDEMAMDRYVFIREAYRQRREFLIHDGNPPVEDLLEDFDLDSTEP